MHSPTQHAATPKQQGLPKKTQARTHEKGIPNNTSISNIGATKRGTMRHPAKGAHEGAKNAAGTQSEAQRTSATQKAMDELRANAQPTQVRYRARYRGGA